MPDPFLGEIKVTSFPFAPTGWALCNGQLMSVNSNQALFSLLGVMYGGDGRTTFALPDLRGRVALHSPTPNEQGQNGGSEKVTLGVNEMPAHNHGSVPATATTGTQASAASGVPAGSGAVPIYTTTQPSGTTFHAAAVTSDGGGQPHENMMPYTVLNYVICTSGAYPSRG